MNKVLNWVFGSFFRTLGRVLVYILIAFLLFYFLKDFKLPHFDISSLLFYNVHADTTIKFNDITLTSSNYAVVPNGTRIINIIDDVVYGSSGNNVYPPSYYIGTFCTDSSDVISWEGTSMSSTGYYGNTYPNTLTQINFFNTKFSCVFPNSSYSGGHIVYLYGSIDPIWNTSATSATLMGRISYSQPYNINDYFSSSWALLSWSFSNEPINIDYSSNSIISQNQEIINQNNTIINNQTNNTNSIINNQNNNTNSIINNQNANSQAEIDSQRVCSMIDISNTTQFGYLNSADGSFSSNTTNSKVTDYINISGSTIKKLSQPSQYNNTLCFYNINKSTISCLDRAGYINMDYISVPNNASYVRFTINVEQNKPTFEICKNGNQALNDSLNDLNSSITDDSINENAGNEILDGLNHEYSSLTPFSDFINLPLTWIQSLLASNQNCTDINLPLPFLNKNLTLPCMTSFWDSMGSLGTLVQLVWIAIVGVRIFNGLFLLTCDTLDPNPDKDMTRLRTWEL